LTVMVSDFAVDATPLESVATTVKIWVVADEEMLPEIRPVDEVRERPVGSDPDFRLQAIDPVPPVEVRVWL
jgi:hypothetical protein